MSDDEQFDSEVQNESVEDSLAPSEEIEEVTPVGDSSVSLMAKDRERQKLQADIEAFLASGGKIETISNNVVSDPPKKPETSYGSQPI